MPRPKSAFRQLNRQRQIFVEAYIAQNFNAVEAARIAGYKHPKSSAHDLVNQDLVKKAIDEKLQEFHSVMKMSADEVMERLTNVARDAKHKDHVRSLEILARVHGLLADKLHVTLDRKSLIAATLEEIKRVKEIASKETEAIDAEYRLLPSASDHTEVPHELVRKA